MTRIQNFANVPLRSDGKVARRDDWKKVTEEKSFPDSSLILSSLADAGADPGAAAVQCGRPGGR